MAAQSLEAEIAEALSFAVGKPLTADLIDEMRQRLILLAPARTFEVWFDGDENLPMALNDGRLVINHDAGDLLGQS